uniref:Uncharacterized protein n=1 Tax=Glossina austeni TaxID=7395 RepID=A0A1A9VC34_GLOAU
MEEKPEDRERWQMVRHLWETDMATTKLTNVPSTFKINLECLLNLDHGVTIYNILAYLSLHTIIPYCFILYGSSLIYLLTYLLVKLSLRWLQSRRAKMTITTAIHSPFEEEALPTLKSITFQSDDPLNPPHHTLTSSDNIH